MPPKDLPRRSSRRSATDQNASPAGITKRSSAPSPSPKARAKQIISLVERRLVNPKDGPADRRLMQHAETLLRMVPAKGDTGEHYWQKQILTRIRAALTGEPITIEGWIKHICCGILSDTGGESLPRLLDCDADEVAKFILDSVVKPYALKWHLFDKVSVAAACVVTADQLLGGGSTTEFVAWIIAGFDRIEEMDQQKAYNERCGRAQRIVGDIHRSKTMVDSAMQAKGGWTEVFLQAIEERVVGPRSSIHAACLYP
ncbi:uncharacterized protein MYCFIDRAFT_83686 [Pseudocercospora fijiensis CIRAD86]|uniref:Uncharacterized protein n=1 Tax=Pseudocercospora fijiensis (strain CIRAD86) TaxID=383855 RepID=M3BB11_PSEFD|nr:uncharacterized protein MYCFIDRAFT_83686 [Pseudocercospora fijiensis CIRAD86]EME86497.1 hypothetical protein MYCFIDRAFT_83686 [Pseudocercospora fijiensis CIRAD86]